MSTPDNQFSGTWLHSGAQKGQQFSHHEADYEHAGEEPSGATPMRHALIDQEGKQVGVWVPADWTDDQARAALETNW